MPESARIRSKNGQTVSDYNISFAFLRPKLQHRKSRLHPPQELSLLIIGLGMHPDAD
jgi:hypothetical protein